MTAAAGARTDLIDWDLALSTASRLVRPGPAVPRAQADAAVAELRELAEQAEQHVVDYTLMVPERRVPVTVVDRPEWVRSNAEGMRLLVRPLTDALTEKKVISGVSAAVGKRITGVQVGAALAFLSSKVLGQYEIFLPPEQGTGRLSLVAPNIVAAEQALGVDPRDFRMWVCLHEQTHRVQFTAVPWLRGHLEGLIGEFVAVSDLDPDALAGRLKAGLSALLGRPGADGKATSVIEAVQTPAQREVLDRVQAVMTLLEGQADHVMDAVGPTVVPSVADIRRSFERRRGGSSPLDKFVRRLLGLDLKLEQYRQGSVFVRAVVDRVGVEGFNRVWESAETLPTRAETTDPQQWLARVHGLAASPTTALA